MVVVEGDPGNYFQPISHEMMNVRREKVLDDEKRCQVTKDFNEDSDGVIQIVKSVKNTNFSQV